MLLKYYSSLETSVVDISCQFFYFLLDILQFEFRVALCERGRRTSHGVESGKSQKLNFRVFGGSMIGDRAGSHELSVFEVVGWL